MEETVILASGLTEWLAGRKASKQAGR